MELLAFQGQVSLLNVSFFNLAPQITPPPLDFTSELAFYVDILWACHAMWWGGRLCDNPEVCHCRLPLLVQKLTSINAFKAGLDLFKLSKPDSPDGFWKLSEEIFNRISDKSEHVNYLLANHDVAMWQNILF